jgi:predicted transcriptional regulator
MTATVAKPIDQLAAAVMEYYGVPSQPPIAIEALAASMGVRLITRARLVEDGRLEHDPADTRIYVSEISPRSRARFTIAHELGHLLLAKPDVPVTAHRMRARINDEERFCDAFAAAVLLPAAWIRTHAQGQRPGIGLARRLSDASGCSLAAVAVRCNELLGWSRALLQWRHDGGGWRWISAAGLPPALHGRVCSLPDTQLELERCRHSGRITSTRLPLGVGDRARRPQAEVMPTPRGAVALVDVHSLGGGR